MKRVLLLVLVVFMTYFMFGNFISVSVSYADTYYYDDISKDFTNFYTCSIKSETKNDFILYGWNIDLNIQDISYFIQPEIYSGVSLDIGPSVLKLTAGPTMYIVRDNNYYNSFYIDLKARLNPLGFTEKWFCQFSIYGGCNVGFFHDRNIFKDYLFYYGIDFNFGVTIK